MGGPSPPPAPATPQLAPGSGAANYIPSNQAGIDTSYNQLFSNLQTGAQGLQNFGIPAVYNYAQNIQNNPYASGALTGTLNASQFAQGTQIPALQSTYQNLTGLGQESQPYANQILQTGFDPQQSLYDRTGKQLQDQYGASNAMAGLSGPAAAGVMNQGMSNFNIDWQNQQLQRQQQAAQGYGNLVQSGTGAINAGMGYLGQIPGTMTGATAIPYSTYNTLQQMPMQSINQAAGTVQSLLNPTTAAMGSALSYLGTGTAASSAFNNAVNQNYGNQLAGYNAQNQAYQNQMSGLGALGGGAFNVASNPLDLFGQSIW